MLSSLVPPYVGLALRTSATLIGLGAAAAALYAARLWLDASKVAIEDTTPLMEVSYDDAPALGILEAIVAVNATKTAYNASAALNAKAARWTALAAILTGVAAFLGAL
jgi:hypothetical protein